MLHQIVHSNFDGGMFQELTSNTLVVCTDSGFEFMKNVFQDHETNNFEFHFDSVDEQFDFKSVSSDEFTISTKDQTIRVFNLSFEAYDEWELKSTKRKIQCQYLFDNFKYTVHDIWFAKNDTTVYAMTEFKKIYWKSDWEKLVDAIYSGRFEV